MPTLPNSPAATVLYVEGNQASRTALAQLLRNQGLGVLEAGTGREALRLAEERPDLILLDVHPPDADGFDLCERFKTTPATASIPVLLFSGVHVKSEDRVRGLEGGADGYLTKPVEAAEVLAQIKALLRVRRAEETLARLAAIVESSEDAVIGKSLDGTITSWNAGAERLYGYTAREVLGQPISILAPPGAPDDMSSILDRLRRGERVEPFETVRMRKDGSRVEVSLSVSPIRDAAGRVVGAAKIAREISQRKAAEAALRESEQRFRQVTENIHEVFWLMDARTGGILYVSPAYEVIWGHTRQSLYDAPRSYLEAVHPDDRSRVADAFDHLRMEGQSEEEYRIVRPDGSVRWIWDRGYPVRDPQREVMRFVGIAEDITTRRTAEGERDEALRSLRMQIDRMPLARIMCDADMRVTDWNPAAERVFGFHKEEVLGREASDLIGPPDVPAEWGEELLRRLRAGDMSANDFYANLTKDGRTIVCQWFNTPLMDADGRFTGLLSLAQDVTARIEAEEALRLRDRAIQAVTQGILITDPRLQDNPIIYASPGFERLTGYAAAEVVGRNCRFLQGPGTEDATVAQVRQAIQERRPCSVEVLNYHKDGTPFWNALSISPVLDGEGRVTHFVGVQADVSERRRLEAQYRQAQKMEAFGQLAGGVAHDFNNLLTVITGYSQLVLEGLSPGDPTRELLEEVCKAGDRSASLTRQLLAFSRQSVLAPRVLDPNAVVRDLEKMLRRLIGEDIDLATALGPAVGRIKADTGQIEQVILNLAVNARDAMPQGGKLTIETRDVELVEEYTRLHVDARPGPYVLLAVSDSGHGMTPEVKARIFEPFFTTKEKGTGLGLATVFGIVQQAGGHVAVYSEPRVGTAFKVYLPRVAEATSSAQSQSDVPATPKGTETVLLVEDEDAVRALARRVLQGAGYRVLETSDGGEALTVAGRHQGPIHLLLSDVVMPVLGGRQLAQRLLALHPEMKVLFQSGYTDDAVVRHGVLQEKVHFLQKPYSPADLTMKVREVLDGPSDSPS